MDYVYVAEAEISETSFQFCQAREKSRGLNLDDPNNLKVTPISTSLRISKSLDDRKLKNLIF